MKNTGIGLLIGGGLLLAGGGLLFMKIFYSRGMVEPDDYRTKTKHNVQTSNKIYPDPNNPIKFNIPEDYGIGHQRADQETYHAWAGKRKRTKNKKQQKEKRYKKSKKVKKTGKQENK